MDRKVSIVIPFYNCAYVEQAVKSALNQTYSNIEVIVVDDGSTIYTEKLEPFLEDILYVKKENGGTATALNTGIQKATGEYIAWLSSDDYFFPEKITKQMDFMIKRGAEVSFANYDYIDKNNQILVPWCGKRFSSDVKEVYEFFLQGNPVNGCTVVMKKDIFDRVGYFNPNFLYTHDYDMWFRLLLTGHKMHYLDEVLIQFRSHEEAGTKKYQAQILPEIAIIENQYRPLLSEYLMYL